MEVCRDPSQVEARKLKILMVDDEEDVLTALQRMLNKYRDQWDIQFCTSGKAALEILAKEAFDILISDMRMPEMTGFQLLARAKNLYPEMVRIVLSGYAESERVVKTAMVAHHYLQKPCQADTLIEAINRARQIRTALSQPRVLQFIKRCTRNPKISPLYKNILEALVTEADPAKAIADLIQEDNSLIAHLMQMQPGGFSSRDDITVEKAILNAGPEIVCALALMLPLFKEINVEVFSFIPVKLLWKDSLYIGKLCKRICHDQTSDPLIQEYAYAAGLINWFGLIILLNNFPQEYKTLAQKALTSQATLSALEIETFGASQFEVGAYWLKQWGFADTVVEAILLQETPSESASKEFSPLTALHIARAISINKIANETWLQRRHLDNAYIQALNLTDKIDLWSSFNE